MAEELDLETLDTQIEKDNKVEKRIKDLSEKVRLTSEERDELKRLSTEKDSAIANLTKERDFLNQFGDALAKYPDATSYKDKIKEKVLKGYSVEDATVATLASEGKFTAKAPEVENPAGGSAAITQPVIASEKPISQLTREEKRQKLIDAEQRGDISVS